MPERKTVPALMLALPLLWSPPAAAQDEMSEAEAFVASNIIGATTMEQLKQNIDSHAMALNSKVLKAIEAIHQRYPNPCP